MTNRAQHIEQFLKNAGWGDSKRSTLAGDASFRHYDRVTGEGRRAVLMDAPPPQEDIRPFMIIGNSLLNCGMSAPRMFASDTEHGFLLLEDLGDDLYSRWLKTKPADEEELYLAAADVLAELYRIAPETDYSAVPDYNKALLMREAMLFGDWFLPAMMGEAEAKPLAQEFRTLMEALCKKITYPRKVLVQRDYHADNLLWLPERDGFAKVGLLDFQDGAIGSPAYDVMSYLEDARRDVGEQTLKRVLTHYLKKTQQDKAEFMANYALLGAQRQCKIIGIFVRLAVRDGKRSYLSLLPRVWGHLETDLKHPLLADVKTWLTKNVPAEWRGALTLDDKMQATA